MCTFSVLRSVRLVTGMLTLALGSVKIDQGNAQILGICGPLTEVGTPPPHNSYRVHIPVAKAHTHTHIHIHTYTNIHIHTHTSYADINWHTHYSFTSRILTHLCSGSRTLTHTCSESCILTHP